MNLQLFLQGTLVRCSHVKKERGFWYVKVVRIHTETKQEYREWTLVLAVLSEAGWSERNKLCDWIKERKKVRRQLADFICNEIFMTTEECFPGVDLDEPNPPKKKDDVEFKDFLDKKSKKKKGSSAQRKGAAANKAKKDKEMAKAKGAAKGRGGGRRKKT